MFSGTVKILDIDDYIKPSQECIKPLMTKTSGSTGIKISADMNEELKTEVGYKKLNIKSKDQELIDLYSDTGGIRPNLIKPTTQNTAKISLNDCLACSGCVTTAETILIQEHNADDFLNKIKTYKHSLVSICPQARASVALYYSTNDLVAHYALVLFFKDLGVKFFWDQALCINIALQQAQNEFIDRYQKFRKEGKRKDLLPLLSSECPGWVCYAEKVAGEEVIPYMSRVKSPQQIFGIIAKELAPMILGATREDIYCATIEPCYDKKLEATREEFTKNQIRDVDTVLSSNELLDIIRRTKDEQKIDFADYIAKVQKSIEDPEFFKQMQEILTLEKFLLGSQKVPIMKDKQASLEGDNIAPLRINSTDRANSNAYSETVVRNSLRVLFPDDYSRMNFEYKAGKNADLEECRVTLMDEEIVTFARVYGLRNIQTVVRNIKKGISKYHYIEIMACPSGCVNGGGLLKPEDKSLKAKDISSAIYSIMTDLKTKAILPAEKDKLAEALSKLSGEDAGIKANLDFSAQFKAVEKSLQTQLKW